MDVNKVNWIVIQKNQLIGAHGKKYYVETQKNITYSSKNSSKGTVTYQNSLNKVVEHFRNDDKTFRRKFGGQTWVGISEKI